MTLKEAIDLAEAHLQATWLRNRKREDYPHDLFVPDEYRKVVAAIGVQLPESWLALLPHFIDSVPCNDCDSWYCSIARADQIVANNSHRCRPDEVKEPSEEFLSTRWFEFGGNDGGDSYTFDLSSPTMPQEARVVFWDHEDGGEIESWDSVVQFVAEMLGPVSELGKREPRPWQP